MEEEPRTHLVDETSVGIPRKGCTDGVVARVGALQQQQQSASQLVRSECTAWCESE